MSSTVHLYFSHFSWEHIYTGTVYTTNLSMTRLKQLYLTHNLTVTREPEHILSIA